MSAPLVIGIVTYRNSRTQLERLLASLETARGVTDFRFAVQWFDNSGDVATERLLRELKVKPADVTRSSENVGFGRAHNALMRNAFSKPETRWYLCLNPDAIVHPDMLTELAAEAQQPAKVGLVEAQQFPDEHPKAYDHATGSVAWCSGCALLVTREAFEATGGYDENIFLYCEDVDLSWRVRAAGLQAVTAPRALVHHYTGDRAPGGRTRIEMVRAGAYLGVKWGDEAFARRCRAEYRELTGQDLVVPTPPPPTREMSGIADFSASFHFASARW